MINLKKFKVKIKINWLLTDIDEEIYKQVNLDKKKKITEEDTEEDLWKKKIEDNINIDHQDRKKTMKGDKGKDIKGHMIEHLEG